MAGTKTRIKQTAATCREHALASGLGCAQEFIQDVEKAFCQGKKRPDRDEAWGVFVDQRQVTQEMLDRVDLALAKYDAGQANFLP